jgi:hypothetical protein
MRTVVFLDFDGVLHRFTTGTFRKLPLFCEFLRANPAIQVVITSTWRLQYPFPELQEFFEPDVRGQIIGVTPDLSQTQGLIAVATTRCAEISHWLASNRDVSRWAILDDEAGLFRTHLERLVLTNPAEGLDEGDLAKIQTRLSRPAVPA